MLSLERTAVSSGAHFFRSIAGITSIPYVLLRSILVSRNRGNRCISRSKDAILSGMSGKNITDGSRVELGKYVQTSEDDFTSN